ncbi:MAG: hypothetical protein AB7D00_03595 [Rhodospirillaceae bacterium]
MSAAAPTLADLDARAVALACRRGISFQAAKAKLVATEGISPPPAGAAISHDAPEPGVNPDPRRRVATRRQTAGNRGVPAPLPTPDPHDPRPGCCRFIHGDPKSPDWRYCNAKAVRGTSWCEAHYRAVYRQPGSIFNDDVRRAVLARRRTLGLAEGDR